MQVLLCRRLPVFSFRQPFFVLKKKEKLTFRKTVYVYGFRIIIFIKKLAIGSGAFDAKTLWFAAAKAATYIVPRQTSV